MKYKPLKGLVVAAMLASSLVLAAPQALAAGPEPSVVTVTGYAQQEVAPDTAQPVPTPMPSRPGPRIIWP